MERSVGIIGLGYVGLPLGIALSQAGLEVVGYDGNPERLAQLRAGRSPIDDVSNDELGAAVARGLRFATPEDDGLAAVDAIVVCVSTPIDEQRQPDLGA